jgi:hypothetical protein
MYTHISHPNPNTQPPHHTDPSEFHCACFFDGQMFIFGGSTGTRRMNDTWRYKLELEPPSLQILAAHALLQQVSTPHPPACCLASVNSPH